MDKLLKAATEYEKLLHKDFLYVLEGDISITLNFQPQHFHHLMGLQKLTDIDQVQKITHGTRPRTFARDIYKDIRTGVTTLDNISKSKYFSEVENRLEYFNQINSIVEYEKIIIDFNTELLGFRSTLRQAEYVLHKQSHTGLYLNLFLGQDRAKKDKKYPLTFIPSRTDQYTYGQKTLRILDIRTINRDRKR